MEQLLDEASLSFEKHLRDIAAEYNRLLERCQILERRTKENVGNVIHTNDGVEAPSFGNVPGVPASSAACDEVLWTEGPEVFAMSANVPSETFGPQYQRRSVAEPLGQIWTRGPEGLASPSAKIVPSESLDSQHGKRPVAESRGVLRNCWSGTSNISSGPLTICNVRNRMSRMDSDPALHSRTPWYSMAAMDPNSATRLVFECITVCVCLYDTIVVPYELAWQPDRQDAFTAVGVATVTFWWSEMGLNFLTGYMDQGVLVLDIKQTALKYLFTWFFLDFVINAVDSVILVLDITLSTTQGSGPAFLKYLRIGKLNRLARIMVIFNRNRLQQVVRSLSGESSNFTLLGLGMRLVAILFVLNHLICCAWYWIGSLSADTGRSWLDMSITSGGVHYRAAGTRFQYMTALHWAVTQMTPGSMSVVPQNSLERAWNVLCLILGLFVSALLISQLSAKMVRVQTVNGTQLQQMETLSRFLVEHDVPRSLAQRIRRQVWERVSRKKMLTTEDLPSLADLPTSLRQELHGALFARSLLSHTVLYSWCVVQDGIAQDICFHVAEELPCAKNDEIFVPGQAAKKVYFLQRGTMTYQREVPLPSSSSLLMGTHPGIAFPDVPVAETDWISTVAIWCRWDYVGRLNTCETCNLVTFNMEKMVDVLKGYPVIRAISHSYACAYVQMATSSEHALQVDLDILPSRVLMAMPLEDRANFSIMLLESFQAKDGRFSMMQYYPARRQRLGPWAQKQLLEELEMGKCVVTVGRDHQLLRTVGLCVLDIVDSSGRVLVQVGTTKKGETTTLDIALPATKVRESESNKQAAMRLIHTELPDMKGMLNFGEVLNEENETRSKNLEIRTMYMKTTYNASFQEFRNSVPVPKLQVSDPPADWSCSQTLSQVGGRSSLKAMAAGMASRRSSRMSERKSMACKSIFAGVTIVPVKCHDKTRFYTWLLRHEFHQVKQVAHGNDCELVATVLKAFSEAERLVSEGTDEMSDDTSRVEI